MATSVTGKATEFIDFTRASNATVTDIDGLIKWAPHNLLLASEQFDSGSYTKTDVTVAANSVAAPNGAATADKIIETAVNSVHTINQQLTLGAAGTYTYGVYLKAAERTKATVYAVTITSGVSFDLSTGTKIADVDVPPIASSISSVGGGWYLCTITVSCAAISNGFRFYVLNAAGNVLYTGDGTSGIYAWGAHLYRSDLGMQANTSAYPMYNPTTAKNLLGFTEDFSNAVWNAGTGASVTSNAAVSPNGLQTADLIYPSSSGSNRQRYQAVTGQVSGTRYTVSVYLKSATMQWVAMLSPNGANYGAYFDLVNGVKGTEASGVTATITPVGDGWYRCSVSQVSSGTTIYGGISFADANGGTTVTASGTSGVYAWGAQLSDSASIDPYFPDYGAAPTAAAYYGPRRDFDPVTLAARGLLVEEQRSNLFTYSDQFDNAIWPKVAASITANTSATLAPDGKQTADKLVEDTTASTLHYINYNPATVGTVGATETLSVFAKAAERSWIRLTLGAGNAVYFNVATGAVGTVSGTVTTSITAVGNGWYRCAMTCVRATNQNNIIYLASADNTLTYTGDGTSGLYLYGAQLEAGSFATSYIPTGAATATRSADVASVSTQAFPYSSTEGTLVANVDLIGYPNNVTNAILTIGSSSANYFGLSTYSSTGLQATASLKTASRVSGTFDVDVTIFSQPNLNTAYKLAGAFKQDDFAGCVNGGAISTDTLGNLPSGVTQMGIGQTVSANYLNGHIRQITYIPRRLSNTELQTRTA